MNTVQATELKAQELDLRALADVGRWKRASYSVMVIPKNFSVPMRQKISGCASFSGEVEGDC